VGEIWRRCSCWIRVTPSRPIRSLR
jgi:hypothetical protein